MRHTFLRFAALAGLVAAYAPTLSRLWDAWRYDSYAGHGVFVPLFSGVLIWSDRKRLGSALGTVSVSGLPLLVGGLALLGLGSWQGSVFLAGISFPISLGGLVWCLYGADLFKEARFPVAFLALWVPLPRVVVDLVSPGVQEWAAAASAGIVGALGIPVFQQGTLLVLPNAVLEVVEGCNGLRFMMALLVLAVAYAHVSQRDRLRQIVVVAAAIPLAVMANWLRIAVITVAAHYWGSEAAEGLLHHSIGKSVWAVALVGLGLFGFMLRGRSKEAKGPAEPSTAQAEGRTTPDGS